MGDGQPGRGRASGRDSRAGWQRGRFGHTFAALDLGTNNCRLLVARPHAAGFRVIDAYSRIVRLGEGLARSGALSEPAMTRAIEALSVCADKMRRRGVTRARAVATEACRRAANGAGFLDRVASETGLQLEIITSGEEARLAMAGCAPLLDYRHAHALVFDIGGGSTELMCLSLGPPDEEPNLVAWTSLPVGVVTLAEHWGGHDVSDAIYDGMVAEVAGLLDGFERAHRVGERMAGQPVQLLGTSGTVTTLAGVHLDLRRYDRARVDGLWIAGDEARGAIDRLRAMSYEARAEHPCVGRDRADLVIAGCAILEAIWRTWPADRLRIADRGVREGILAHLMREADDDPRTAGRAGSGLIERADPRGETPP